MTYLRGEIERLDRSGKRLARQSLPERPLLWETNKTMAQADLEEGQMPAPEELLAISRRITDLVRSGSASDVTRKDWRRAAWCMWHKDLPLAQDAKARSAYFDWLRTKGRWAHGALVANYLRDFDANNQSFAEVGRELVDAVKRYDVPWRVRHERYRLFAPAEAPRRIAERVLDDERPILDALENAGLVGDFMCLGLGSAAFAAALNRYRERAASVADPTNLLDRILAWGEVGGHFQFGALRGLLGTSLLMPWISSKSPPAELVVDRTRDFLLEHLKDPRRDKGLWNGVDPQAIALMRQWLAKASLEQFLQIVDDIASPELKLQWPYRRQFWEAYEKKGVISDAWVAFADQGARRARQVFEGTLPFGRLRSGQILPNHAVLLLRLGSLTVAEWSENGKCHLWLPGNDRAPNLYRDSYSRFDVTAGSDNDGVSHTSSETGNWQRKVASWIERHTNIRVRTDEYMLRRR